MPGKCSALAQVESAEQLEALRSLLAGLCPTAPTMSDEWEQCLTAGSGRELRARCKLHAGKVDDTSWCLRHAAAVSGATSNGAEAAPVLPLSTVESTVVGPIREFMGGLGYDMTKEYVRRNLDFVKPPASTSGKLALPVHISHFEICMMAEKGNPSSRDPRKPDAPSGLDPSTFGWLEVYAEVEDVTNAAHLAATRGQVQQIADLFGAASLKFRSLGMRSPELRLL